MRLVKRTQQFNATWYSADHMCSHYNDCYVLSIKSAIFIESTRSDMRMLNSNNVVFKWSDNPDIGWQNVAPLLRQNLTEVKFYITSYNIIQHFPSCYLKGGDGRNTDSQQFCTVLRQNVSPFDQGFMFTLKAGPKIGCPKSRKRFHSSCKLRSSAKVNLIKISEKRCRKKVSPVQSNGPVQSMFVLWQRIRQKN